MKFIITILSLFTLGIQLSSQVPNNVTDPYSVRNNINLDLNPIQSFYFEKPNIENITNSDIYAIDIEMSINILERGTKKILPNGKELTLIKVKANSAKSLNLTFENLYLSNNSKMFIYSLDRKQVMGPITSANNNKVFNTHIILTDEVIIEVISDKEADDFINLTNVAYGIKDAEYFMTINAETYNKYSTQSSGCLQSMLDTKHDCNYLTRSSGVYMNQPNCSDFDGLEKSKRAICVIISHNSDSNHWEAKGGILINTVSDTSANYCNSYILTCAHCLTGYFGETYPYVDPNNIVVRFNWLRKECVIPPSIQPCITDKAAWESLINYDEVVDYCDVELVERDYSNTWPPLSKRIEYAFLKVNEPLRFKEYFNGWKIYDYLASGDRESSILGPWGGNPIEGKVIDVWASGNLRNITWNLVDTVAGGHSGTSLLEGEYLTGIVNIKNSATSMGTLYLNRCSWLAKYNSKRHIRS